MPKLVVFDCEGVLVDGEPIAVRTRLHRYAAGSRLDRGGLLPHATVKIYPDAAHGFLFQHHTEFAADVTKFLG
jgi:beta-phosphoglucomutase-like phosphatase (HAD superfamily)